MYVCPRCKLHPCNCYGQAAAQKKHVDETAAGAQVGMVLGVLLAHPWTSFFWLWVVWVAGCIMVAVREGWIMLHLGPPLYQLVGAATVVYLPVAYLMRRQIQVWVPRAIAFLIVAVFAAFIVWMLWNLWKEIDATFCLGRC